MSVNKALLIGNLGKDPEVRFTASGRAVARFPVATSEVWNDAEGQRQERTEWHHVVEHADADQLARLTQALGDGRVLGRRRRVAARVVVDEDEGRGGRADGGGEDLARVDERRGERALGDAHLALHAVLAVEQEDVEDLALELREAAAEVRVDGGRIAHRAARRERRGGRTPAELER